ncbi:hypothetical protein LJC36_04785, partial [Desulfovibrio sp. OttesenSCG-928-C14]|nr:hypothetical protein [Desulfovibrio sp. OttesenSCG-928-C14]
DDTGNYAVYGGADGDTLSGGAGNDFIYGEAGNDTLRGGAGDNELYGGAGSDTLYNDSATDKLYGEADADSFRISDKNGDNTVNGADFALIDGGTGIDTLYLEGSGQTLDLASIPTAKIRGIETVDITGGGDNHVILNSAMLAHLSASLDGQAQLRIKGNAGDSIDLAGSWTFGGTHTDGDGITWNAYSSGGKTVWVQDSLERVYTAPGQNATFVVDDRDGDGIIDFGKITGSSGTADSIRLSAASTGKNLDLTGLGGTEISGVEIFDLSQAGGANTITLDAESLGKLGFTPASNPAASIKTKPGGGDGIVLEGEWILTELTSLILTGASCWRIKTR